MGDAYDTNGYGGGCGVDRGIGVVSLHASKLGRPIYERNGFVDTNEMMLRESERA